MSCTANCISAPGTSGLLHTRCCTWAMKSCCQQYVVRKIVTVGLWEGTIRPQLRCFKRLRAWAVEINKVFIILVLESPAILYTPFRLQPPPSPALVSAAAPLLLSLWRPPAPSPRHVGYPVSQTFAGGPCCIERLIKNSTSTVNGSSFPTLAEQNSYCLIWASSAPNFSCCSSARRNASSRKAF